MPGLPNFTGAFVGMACQDLARAAISAAFDHFHYFEYSDDPASSATPYQPDRPSDEDVECP